MSDTISAENSRRNLQTLAANTRDQLDLNDQPASWTFEEQQQYNLTLAQGILDRPQSFTEASLASARIVLGHVGTKYSIQDTGALSVAGDFVAAVADQAESINPLSEQNRGKLALLLGGALLVGVAVYAWGLSRRTPSPA
jgi:hypothetical protein